LNQQNSGPPDLSVNRQQQIASIFPVIQNPQQQGADSEGSQTQRQNTIARNSHTVMEIDMESEGRDINPPPLEAKINQASLNRYRDHWATKSYLLKYIGKPGAGQHHPGYGEGQIEVQEVILRHARGETISIADWRKFWKELDADLKLITVRLQSPVSDSEDQGREKDQSTAFWNNPRKRYRQDDNVSPWPPVESVPATSSNTVVPDLTQRQIGGPTPQLPSISTSQSSETTSSNIIPIPTPSVQQVQQEQDHLLHPPVAVSPPPINPANIELPPVDNTLPDNITQSINNILVHQQQAQNQQQLVNQQQQLFNQQNQQFINQQYKLPDPPDSWWNIVTQPLNLELRAQHGVQRLHDQRILQENRARNEYRIHMQQRAQNKAQKYLMDGMLMNLEARSKDFDNPSYHPFGNFELSFNPNQYIDNLSQIPSQDQQKYSNDFDQNQMQRDDDHDSNDEVFGDADLIELQVRGRRGRGKKNRGRGKGSTQSKLKVPGQRRGKTGAANGTINPSAQSSR
ncbi:MAG: hypothetical protein EZS28_038446, partial [Streblomastix strix]